MSDRVVLPVVDLYAFIPQAVREQMKPFPQAGFIVNNQIVQGFIVKGLPIVYIPGRNTTFSELRKPPIPNWADYSISRLSLDENRDQVPLITREDTTVRRRHPYAPRRGPRMTVN
jgi:hypothetical protein